jgi:hypothetical protein
LPKSPGNDYGDIFQASGNWIDKNLLLVDGSIRNALLCVKNILAQDVGCGANGRVEGVLRHPFF